MQPAFRGTLDQDRAYSGVPVDSAGPRLPLRLFGKSSKDASPTPPDTPIPAAILTSGLAISRRLWGGIVISGPGASSRHSTSHGQLRCCASPDRTGHRLLAARLGPLLGTTGCQRCRTCGRQQEHCTCIYARVVGEAQHAGQRRGGVHTYTLMPGAVRRKVGWGAAGPGRGHSTGGGGGQWGCGK